MVIHPHLTDLQLKALDEFDSLSRGQQIEALALLTDIDTSSGDTEEQMRGLAIFLLREKMNRVRVQPHQTAKGQGLDLMAICEAVRTRRRVQVKPVTGPAPAEIPNI